MRIGIYGPKDMDPPGWKRTRASEVVRAIQAWYEVRVSYSMIPYAVDVEKLNGLIAARDQDTFERAAEGLPTARIEAFLEKRLFGDKGPAPSSLLRHLMFDETPSPSAGSAYYYVYEHLCGLAGQRLEHAGWTHKTANFPKQVSSALVRAGVLEGFDMALLTGGRSVIWLPRHYEWNIDKYPQIGFINGEGRELYDAMNALARGHFAIFETGKPAIRNAVEDLEFWVARCLNDRQALVTFYYEI